MYTVHVVITCILCFVQIQVGDMGCELNCSTMTDHTQDHKFVIGRPELVQFFTIESPAQCFGFEGELVFV